MTVLGIWAVPEAVNHPSLQRVAMSQWTTVVSASGFTQPKTVIGGT
jgi:hypothetical protein